MCFDARAVGSHQERECTQFVVRSFIRIRICTSNLIKNVSLRVIGGMTIEASRSCSHIPAHIPRVLSTGVLQELRVFIDICTRMLSFSKKVVTSRKVLSMKYILILIQKRILHSTHDPIRPCSLGCCYPRRAARCRATRHRLSR